MPGLGEGEIGPDVDDPALTLEVWRERIRRHPGELKNLLRNQAFVAGIGNAYSDEILHAARLLPFRKRSTLAEEEVDALYEATRSTVAARDRGPARARPTDLRDAGPRLPRGPHEGRSAVSAMRDPDHRGQGRWLRDVVLPRLPALSRDQGSSRTWPTRSSRGLSMPLSSWRTATVVPNSRGDPAQGVAAADLVGRRSRRRSGCLGPGSRRRPRPSVGTRVRLARRRGGGGRSRRAAARRRRRPTAPTPTCAGVSSGPPLERRAIDDRGEGDGHQGDQAALAGPALRCAAPASQMDRRPWSRTSGAVRVTARRATVVAGRCGPATAAAVGSCAAR